MSEPSWTSTGAPTPDAETILGALGDFVVVVAPDGTLAAMNETAASMVGRSPGDLVGEPVLNSLHPDDLEATTELLMRYARGVDLYRPVIRLQRTDGSPVAVEFIGQRHDTETGRYLIFSGRAEPVLDSEEVISGIGIGVVIANAAGEIIESNPAAATLLAGTNEALLGPAAEIGTRFTRPDSDPTEDVEHPMSRALREQQVVTERVAVTTPAGTTHIVDVEARPVSVRYSGPAAVLMTLTDVSARHAAEAALVRAATTDDLTGVANRSTFMELVDARIDRSEPGDVAVLFCDLDRFKSVNERFGHGEADRLLRRFAHEMTEALAGTTIGRFGGDEFAVAADITDVGELDDLAEAIRGAARRASLATLHVVVTASVGASWTGDDARDATEIQTAAQLIEEADEALRRAKRTGRDRFAFFDHTMRDLRSEQTRMARQLRDHLADERVEIAIQPVIDPRDGRVSGGEALARIRDEHGELIPAARWIDAATRAGLIQAVDEQVIRLASQLLGQLHASAGDTPAELLPVIGVNLSDGTMARPDLFEWLTSQLTDAGAPTSGLVIEIPETVFPVIRDRSADALRQLKAAGLWVAIDDFGVGYASLAEVRDLPIDTLKIDRSFVIADQGTPEEAILRAAIEMSRAMNCRSVAEGVETQHQLELMLALGVDYVQGYFTSRPLPHDEFVDFSRSAHPIR